jgi:hypothetical protein
MENKVVTLDDIERRLVSEHLKPHYDWIRHVVSLSTASLTLLVSLQSHYVPKVPKGVWLVALCWLLLALAILCGLLALRGEDQTLLDAARDLRQKRVDFGDEATAAAVMRNSGFTPRPIYAWARRLMICSFSAGVVTLAIFAVWNLPL